MATIINGIEYSWADVRMKVRGREITGFKAVKYGDKVTREKVYGASRHALARTRGKVEVDDCSMTLYESALRDLIAELGDGWSDVRIGDIVVQYGKEGQTIQTDVLEDVLLEGFSGGADEGTTALERELAFSCMRIKRNGSYIVAVQ